MNKINPETKVLGLIGNPVKDSLSPKLQNKAIDELGLNYRYFAFQVKEGGVERAVVGGRELGFRGLNVTVPHKRRVTELVDDLSNSAEAIGAVNTLVFDKEENIRGKNTDWSGFVKSLKIRGFNPKDKSCLVFGAGGGARGVVYGLLEEGIDKIVVANRTVERAEKLVKDMESVSVGANLIPVPLSAENLADEVKTAELVVNATSVGMGATRGESVWEDPESFHEGQLVYDLVYNPYPTEFLKLAGGQGAETVGGLDMLILQGLESLKSWTGEEFSIGNLLEVLRGYLLQE
jgi:shikimate dehydrogenase